MKKTAKKLLSLLCAAVMLCMLLPVSALAVGESAPEIEQLSIAGTSSVSDGNGNLYLTLPGTMSMADANIGIVTSDAVDFSAANAPATGELYVSGVSDGTVSLNFNISAGNYDFNSEAYTITLTSSDKTNWSGAFAESYDVNASTFAAALNLSNATLRADSFASGETGNAVRKIYCNSDSSNIQLVICDPDSTMYTVTYYYGNESYVWTLPAGATLTQPTLPGNLILEGWYTDANHTQAAVFGGAVTGNTALYANLVDAEDVSSFASALENKDTVLYINSNDDWASFINNASKINSNQRVELLKDINCNNATYTALTFAGDFNGNNHTVSNATFNASSGNSGLFASLGAGQVVANLKLDNITAKYASTYAGALVGQVTGGEGNRALIQNIQVTNCSVSGRSAAGIAGFTIFTDVTYCSSRNCTVTGVANGAGIVGINYGKISECYSTVRATAISSKGGISGKNLEGGTVNDCWCTESTVVGNDSDESTYTNVLNDVSASTYARDMRDWATHGTIWSFAAGTGTTFNQDAVTYPFV